MIQITAQIAAVCRAGRVLALGLACWTGMALAQAGPLARGLIVQLKSPVPGTAAAVETPKAARDRLAAVARSSGLAMQASRALGTSHHLLSFSHRMQGAELDTLVQRMRFHPDVESVEPDVLIKRQAVPNDPFFASRQWNLQAPGVNLSAIGMPAAWDRSTGTAVNVAVLDTGVRPSHPDLAGKLLPGYDFVSDVEYANDGDGRDADPSDPGDWVTSAETRGAVFSGCEPENSSWHGTFIAGQIAAATNNALGVAGVSWGARILPVRVSGKCGAFLSDILDALRWSAGLAVAGVPANANPARIINLSFGGDAACSATYQSVIDEITAAGSLLVVAGGNESTALRRPADCRGVLAVGAARADGLKASYANFGANLALTAPGGEAGQGMYSLDNSGVRGPAIDTYGEKFGSSFSTPLASGVAALMLSVNPALSPAQLVTRMQRGARAHAANAGFASCSEFNTGVCSCTLTTCGAGLLDAPGALEAAALPVPRMAVSGNLQPGGTVVLGGAGSQAATGATVRAWQWSQVSGSTVSLQAASSATASFVLPAAAGDFSFRLQVTDDLGRVASEVVQVTSSPDTSGGVPLAGGGGGGALEWPAALGLWLLVLLAWLSRVRPRPAQTP